jgi:hypothetical protein
MGKSLLAVISTRRPNQDSVSADAELLGSELNRLLGPPELSAIGPYASQDHGNLARYGDTGFLGAYAPYQSCPPSLEWRPALYFGQKGAGGFIEASSGEAVSAFRDFALSIRFSGLIPPRCQSQIGANVPGSLESVWFIDRGSKRQCGHRTDTWHSHETP